LGTVGPVLQRLRDGDFTAVYSEPLLDEMLAKLALPRIRRKYSVTDDDVLSLLALLAVRGELVAPQRRVKVCRDPNDDMVIEAAIEAGAAWIVTGDGDLLTLERFEKVRIVTPRTFLAAF
jgi:putative PIN family toxin of toxin-antitoxin system